MRSDLWGDVWDDLWTDPGMLTLIALGIIGLVTYFVNRKWPGPPLD